MMQSNEQILLEQIFQPLYQQIKNNQYPNAAPDEKYLKSLQEIGIIKLGWDNELTDFGREMLKYLEPEW